MNKQTFFKILTREIKGLPQDERQNALDYYTEHLSECENEEIAISNLPHPREIAQNLYDELGIEKRPARYYSPLAIIGIIVLSVLFGPLGFGLAVALFSLIIIVPGSFAFALGTTAIASVFVIIPASFSNPANILSFLGLSLLCSGGCMLFSKITVFTFKLFVSICKKTFKVLRGY